MFNVGAIFGIVSTPGIAIRWQFGRMSSFWDCFQDQSTFMQSPKVRIFMVLTLFRCRTIALETGFQNAQLCSTIVQLSFSFEELELMFAFPLIYSIFQMVAAVIFVGGESPAEFSLFNMFCYQFSELNMNIYSATSTSPAVLLIELLTGLSQTPCSKGKYSDSSRTMSLLPIKYVIRSCRIYIMQSFLQALWNFCTLDCSCLFLCIKHTTSNVAIMEF